MLEYDGENFNENLNENFNEGGSQMLEHDGENFSSYSSAFCFYAG